MRSSPDNVPKPADREIGPQRGENREEITLLAAEAGKGLESGRYGQQKQIPAGVVNEERAKRLTGSDQKVGEQVASPERARTGTKLHRRMRVDLSRSKGSQERGTWKPRAFAVRNAGQA